MATDFEVAQQINSSKLRLDPVIDHSKEKMKEGHIPSYGGMKSYSDKVFDMVSTKAKEVGDTIRDSYRKAEDVSKNLYQSLIGDVSSSYAPQPAYSSPGKSEHCGYC